MPIDKRDFREETLLNATEERALKQLATEFGLSKSSTLRHCLLMVVDHVARKERIASIGEFTEL
jgi:hypothetical protein